MFDHNFVVTYSTYIISKTCYSYSSVFSCNISYISFCCFKIVNKTGNSCSISCSRKANFTYTNSS